MYKLVLRNTFKRALYKNGRLNYSSSFDFMKQVIRVKTKPSELPPETKISKEVISQLEAISLVNFGDEEGIKIVEDAISYANKLEEVNTDGVNPLYTVLENEALYLREDTVKKDIKTADILSHAQKTFEGYYIAPVGNISYSDNKIKFKSKTSNTVNEKSENLKIKSVLSLSCN